MERKLRTKVFAGTSLVEIAENINTFLQNQPGNIDNSFADDDYKEWLFIVSVTDTVVDEVAPLGIGKADGNVKVAPL